MRLWLGPAFCSVFTGLAVCVGVKVLYFIKSISKILLCLIITNDSTFQQSSFLPRADQSRRSFSVSPPKFLPTQPSIFKSPLHHSHGPLFPVLHPPHHILPVPLIHPHIHPAPIQPLRHSPKLFPLPLQILQFLGKAFIHASEMGRVSIPAIHELIHLLSIHVRLGIPVYVSEPALPLIMRRWRLEWNGTNGKS